MARADRIIAGWNAADPGRRISATPPSPTATADQRRQPTGSDRNTAAPRVVMIGPAWAMAVTSDSGSSDSAVIPSTIASISPPLRTSIGVHRSSGASSRAPVERAIANMIAVPPMPSSNRISPTGTRAEASLMNMSSVAKPAIVRIISSEARKLSVIWEIIGRAAVRSR